MIDKRMAGTLAAGLLLVGCGSQVSSSQTPGPTKMDPARYFSLLRTEPCPPCTICLTFGAGSATLISGPLTTFNFFIAEGNAGNQVNVTEASTLGVFTYAATSSQIVICTTEGGRDIIRVIGTMTRTNTSTSQVEPGTYLLQTSVDAGTQAGNPSFLFQFTGSQTTQFEISNTTANPLVLDAIGVDTDAPCPVPE